MRRLRAATELKLTIELKRESGGLIGCFDLKRIIALCPTSDILRRKRECSGGEAACKAPTFLFSLTYFAS